MNKVLQQVDELEQRALNSETTLDDVRAELLRVRSFVLNSPFKFFHSSYGIEI